MDCITIVLGNITIRDRWCGRTDLRRRRSGYRNRRDLDGRSGYRNRRDLDGRSGYRNRRDLDRRSGYRNRRDLDRRSGYRNRRDLDRRSGRSNSQRCILFFDSYLLAYLWKNLKHHIRVNFIT